MRFLINGDEDSSPQTTAVTYNAISANMQSTWVTTETQRDGIVPSAMTLQTMYIEITTAPGAGKSWVFEVVKNGTAAGLAVTISDTATAGNATGAVAYAAGDTISLRATPSGTPSVTGRLSWSFVGSTTGAFFPVFGIALASPVGGGTYTQLQGGTSTWPGLGGAEQVVPLSGTIRDLYVVITTAPGAGKSWAFKVMLNAGGSGPEVVISDAATSGQDLVTTLAFSAGDKLALRATDTNAPAAPGTVVWACVCVPDTNGESFIMYATSDFPSNVATEYAYLQGDGTVAWNATEANRTQVLAGGTAKKLYAEILVTPGILASWTFTLRKEAADTALTITLTDADLLKGNVTADVVLTPGDGFSWESTPSAVAPDPMATVKLGLLVFFELTALVDPMRSGGMVVPYER